MSLVWRRPNGVQITLNFWICDHNWYNIKTLTNCCLQPCQPLKVIALIWQPQRYNDGWEQMKPHLSILREQWKTGKVVLSWSHYVNQIKDPTSFTLNLTFPCSLLGRKNIILKLLIPALQLPLNASLQKEYIRFISFKFHDLVLNCLQSIHCVLSSCKRSSPCTPPTPWLTVKNGWQVLCKTWLSVSVWATSSWETEKRSEGKR